MSPPEHERDQVSKYKAGVVVECKYFLKKFRSRCCARVTSVGTVKHLSVTRIVFLAVMHLLSDETMVRIQYTRYQMPWPELRKSRASSKDDFNLAKTSCRLADQKLAGTGFQ
jgi:hypothetical protein